MFGNCKEGGCLERYLLGKMFQEVLYKGKKLKLEKDKWEVIEKRNHYEVKWKEEKK